jgi:hypothetical protein
MRVFSQWPLQFLFLQYIVKSYKEHVDFEKEHGTDRETFYTVHVIKSHMADIEEGMLQTKSRTGFISIVFRENGDIVENLNTFGSLSLKSSTKTTTFRKDAHLVRKEEYKEKFIQSFNYSYEFNVSADQDVMITGMAITDDKRLLLCGGGKYNIIVCTLQGNFQVGQILTENMAAVRFHTIYIRTVGVVNVTIFSRVNIEHANTRNSHFVQLCTIVV